jgi:hypothetical protein
MAITSARCAVCQHQAYRNKYGQMLAHTRVEWIDVLRKRAVICEGSDKGARV